jgi:hypothetical protein
MAAKVEYPTSVTSPQPDRTSISKDSSCGNRQSDEPLPTKRIQLGGLAPNAVRSLHDRKQALESYHAAFSAQGSAGTNPGFGKTGRLPSPSISVKGGAGGMRAEDNKGSFHPHVTGSAILPPLSRDKSRPSMSHSNSSPQLYSPQYHSDNLDSDQDRSIPPPCDARKHRHHSPPTICIGSAPSPTKSGSSSGGVLLSTVRDRANRHRSSSSVARHDALNRTWLAKRDDLDDGTDEETLVEPKRADDARREYSLSEVDNR